MNHVEATALAFQLFANRYGRKWDFQPSVAPRWAEWLEEYGITPEDILTRAKEWSSEEKWPPTYPEFLEGLLPCRCGKNTCWECSQRAYAARCRALENGSAGGDADVPVLPARGATRFGEIDIFGKGTRRQLPGRRE